MDPDFMRGERVVDIKLTCTECGKPAQGNASWNDGSGEICDDCLAKDQDAEGFDEAAFPFYRPT